MSGLTREAIVKALHDKGAYCGVCDYETALDGTPGCTECRQVLEGYADAILALTPTVDRDTIAHAIFAAPAPIEWQGQWAEIIADAVLAVLPGSTVADGLRDQPRLCRTCAGSVRKTDHGMVCPDCGTDYVPLSVEDARAEATRRWPLPFGSYDVVQRDAFVAGAEWWFLLNGGVRP